MDIIARLDRVYDVLNDRNENIHAASVNDAMNEIREMRTLLRRYLEQKYVEEKKLSQVDSSTKM
jgi:hypothetical protein